MRKKHLVTEANAAPIGSEALRAYRAPWKGHLLLACGKCQKKLKRSGEHEAVAKLKKTLKQQARALGGPRLHLIQVSCLKLCPNGGVTVVTEAQMTQSRCSIVRNGADVRALYAACTVESTATPASSARGW